MRNLLRAVFVAVLGVMLYGTAVAINDRSLWLAVEELWRDPWFRVTVFDSYFAFLTVWLWIAYREPGWPRRLIWLIAIGCLGNFAVASYMLLRLGQLQAGEPVWRALLRPEHR